MNLDKKKILKTLNPNKVWLPAVLGLGFVVFQILTQDDFTPDKLNLIFKADFWPVVFAFVVLVARDAGYVYRIRAITNEQLDWTASIYVILMWEFASAVTPSIVGGTAVAVFILIREGINLGKSLAFVMLTAIMDNLFFVIAAPIALIITGGDILPDLAEAESKLGKSLPAIFLTSYSLIAIYTSIMGLALFYRPRTFKWFLLKVTSIKYLRKWRYDAYQQGNEIIWASEQLKGQNFKYWMKIVVSTIFIWSARYLMLNFLVEAYVNISITDHFIVFGKNLILWITMLFSPTPGSSGTAEFFFPMFYGHILGDFTLAATLFWRVLSYYPYLIIGALLLPKWLQRTQKMIKKKKIKKSNP